MSLTLYRRHTQSCAHRGEGAAYLKCACPIWCDGDIDGKRLRRSLDTRDWARATKKLGKIEDPSYGLRACAQPGCSELVERGRCARHTREIPRAIEAYHQAHQDASQGTRISRRATLGNLQEFFTRRGLKTVDQVDLEALNGYRVTREVKASTWTKELGTVRHFFRFCLDNEWIFRSWAEKVSMPKNVQPADREPYTPNEVARIIAACNGIGRGAYERLRARAMVLLLRYTALRISDVATLEKSRIRRGEIFVRTTKNGKPVRLPVHADLQAALDVLPAPRGAADPANCPYFFWSGNGGTRAIIRDARRTLDAVYVASGVEGACSHRFRHTLATEILEMGGTFEEAADILGDTEAIIRKHYAKWSAGRQARISNLLVQIWYTKSDNPQVIEKKM